ncbi:hypothetical protein ABZ819_05240 [Streptomyces venezuelae]|uniref:hypothetical protein n=1 Tax=Streptomyces venezuelae TaxID=54571 RepID=UPI003424A96B
MSDPQQAAEAAKVAAQVINDYGADSDQAVGALSAVVDGVEAARASGHTDDDIRNA